MVVVWGAVVEGGAVGPDEGVVVVPDGGTAGVGTVGGRAEAESGVAAPPAGFVLARGSGNAGAPKEERVATIRTAGVEIKNCRP